MDVSDPIFDPIFSLATQTYPGMAGGAGMVIRELLLQALGWDPEKAARVTARRMAYLDALIVARHHLGRAMFELTQKLEADGLAAEAARAQLISEGMPHDQ